MRIISMICLLGMVTTSALADSPRFESIDIDPNIGNVCYAVTLADVDGDGKRDIVAVSENAVYWYENPSWKKRVVIKDQTARDNVCIAPADIDGDGKIDFALGAGWTRKGTIQWLSRGDSLDEPWKVFPIGAESWLHRMRWGDLLGTGKPQLVISPLRKTVGDGVRLIAFEIPSNPAKDKWVPHVLDQERDLVHNHWIVDFNGDGTPEMLTASKRGVSLFARNGKNWSKKLLHDQSPGAGEVKTGRLGDRRIVGTIEPMHGEMAVVYVATDTGWKRMVLDKSLGEGHAVWLADFNQDGMDELVVGHRKPGTGKIKGPGLYYFDAADSSGTSWQKHIIDDGGMATEDVVAADLDGDGWVDIVAGGRATHNVKLYRNRGK